MSSESHQVNTIFIQYVDNGRSTPGAKQANTTPVEYRKAAGATRKSK